MDTAMLLGPIDLLEPFIKYLVLILVIVNMATRHMEYRQHVDAVEDGQETLERYRPHVASNVALVLATFYLLSVEYHSGVVMSILVLGLFISDFFEFEARQVEVRNELEIERPKASIFASGVAFLYAAYLAIFFIVEPAWRLIFA